MIIFADMAIALWSDTLENDYFEIITFIYLFFKKHVEMIMMWFLTCFDSVPHKYVFLQTSKLRLKKPYQFIFDLPP